MGGMIFIAVQYVSLKTANKSSSGVVINTRGRTVAEKLPTRYHGHTRYKRTLGVGYSYVDCLQWLFFAVL